MFIQEEITAISQSTPMKEKPEKPEADTTRAHIKITPTLDPIEVLKKRVNETLTFLHQERNDFLPQEDIIIPSRKDDHVSMEINLDSIKKLKEQSVEKDTDEIAKNVRAIVQTELTETIKDLDLEIEDEQVHDINFRNEIQSEVSAVIKAAEDAVNELKSQEEIERPNLAIRLNSNANELVNNVQPTQIRIVSFDTTSSTTTNDSAKTEKDFDSLTDLSGSFTKEYELKEKDFESLQPDSLKSEILENDLPATDNTGLKHDDSFDRVVQEKSAEAFKFLETEISSPAIPTSLDFVEIEPIFPEKKGAFSHHESPTKLSPTKSSIPVAKTRQSKIEKEKDLDTLYNQVLDRVSSPTEGDLLSKIPVSSCKVKVKTIKKHSKDPLKEFVKLTQDVNWDDTDNDVITTTITKTSDPIVKTTVTRITTTETSVPETTRSKIPVYHSVDVTESSENKIPDRTETHNKSKIPVLHTETTRIVSPEVTHVERTIISPSQIVDTTLVSPGSDRTKTSTKSSTIDSDSDSDSRRSPPLKGILKKSSIRTIGSSSGSDVALHEGGAELSDDDSGRL